ncbi:MAG: AraC family transcriptional regulator [Agriterribacter sp.]
MKINTDIDTKIRFSRQLPISTSPYIQGSEKIYATGNFGEIISQKISENKYSFWYSVYNAIVDSTIYIHKESDWLGFRLMLKNDLCHTMNGKEEIYLKQGQFNFVYLPMSESSFTVKKSQSYCVFDMCIDKCFLFKLREKLPIAFITAVERNSPKLLFSNACWSNVYILDTIELLMCSPRNEDIAITLIKQVLDSAANKKEKIPITSSQNLAICSVRDIIKQNLSSHISIKELAKRTGINTWLLKNGFHQVFDKTPYQYLLYERLKFVKTLLQKTDFTIQYIAEQTGFSSAASLVTQVYP